MKTLAARAVEAFLVQRAADPLHDHAAHLLVDQHPVEHPPAVLDRPVLKTPDHSGIDVDVD